MEGIGRTRRSMPPQTVANLKARAKRNWQTATFLEKCRCGGANDLDPAARTCMA